MGGRAIATAATLAFLGGTAEGAAARTDTLPVLAGVGDPPASIEAGTAFTARVRVVNRSRRVSRRAVVTFKLVPPSGRGVALRGRLSVRAMKPRARKSARLRLTVPPTAAPRAYRLEACIKRARGRAACRASGRFVTVRAPGTPAPDPGGSGTSLPVVSIAAPAEGADNPGRRPEFSGTGQAGGTVSLTIRTAAGGTAQTLTAPVAGSGAWSARPAADLAPGSYAAVAEQTNAAGTGRSASRAFSVAAVMLAAGDIATCPIAGSPAEATAQILDGLPSDVIAVLGDLAYENGTTSEFNNCYGPTWGRHKSRERPAAGNHEYGTAGASGYFTYFGDLAGQPGQGYYSYDVGNWHVAVLNSNCADVPCGATSGQAAWLTADLQAHPRTCTLAYMHHPLFTSHNSSATAGVAPLWQILDDRGVDVLLVGHSHIYERWKPQTSTGVADPNGVRQWIVGTGGRYHHAIDVNPQPANSQVRNDNTFGVLNLTLRATGYDWSFVPVPGASFTDSGSDSCR
jgi:hypothetical protein